MAFDKVFKEVADEIEATVTKNVQTNLDKRVSAKLAEVDSRLETAQAGADLNIINNGKTVKVKGKKHNKLPQLIQIAAQRLPILLVGPAGTGKTYAAEQVAEALKLTYRTMSVGAQTSKSDLLGFINANGLYIPSHFRKAYQEGGLFLLDEIDAGNSNVLTMLNAALANGICAFPDKMVECHSDFVFIGSANTYGLGASRQYVGRNQLDAATLDRFVVIDWPIDNRLEFAMAGKSEVAKQWLGVVRAVRKYVESEGIRALITPRATTKGRLMLEAGIDYPDVVTSVLLAGISEDRQDYLREIARKAWNKSEPETETKPETVREFEVGDKVRVNGKTDVETIMVLDGNTTRTNAGWHLTKDLELAI